MIEMCDFLPQFLLKVTKFTNNMTKFLAQKVYSVKILTNFATRTIQY